jgi:uncharacterized protein (DUF2147 family)
MRVLSAFTLGLAALSSASALAAVPIAGLWTPEDGRASIQVGPCGTFTCGHIVRYNVPTPEGPPVDKNNPDPKLRGRLLSQIYILSSFVDKGKQWEGRIYDPNNGKSYRSIVFRNADGTLSVKGCIVFFCRTQTWKPAR